MKSVPNATKRLLLEKQDVNHVLPADIQNVNKFL